MLQPPSPGKTKVIPHTLEEEAPIEAPLDIIKLKTFVTFSVNNPIIFQVTGSFNLAMPDPKRRLPRAHIVPFFIRDGFREKTRLVERTLVPVTASVKFTG